MSEQDLLKAFIGFALGIVGTYLGLYWKVRKELTADYDKDLRSDRLKVYPELWKHTEVLAYYSPPGPVTARGMRELSVQLRSWYYCVGGLFLSEGARDAYFMLQKALTTLHAPASDAEVELDPGQASTLRALASDLRTALTADVGSRSKPLLARDDGD